jgi:hypothetical protein
MSDWLTQIKLEKEKAEAELYAKMDKARPVAEIPEGIQATQSNVIPFPSKR